MVWFIIISVLMSDGTLVQKTKFIDVPILQNKESCIVFAKEASERALKEISTVDKNARVWGLCDSVEKTKILDLAQGSDL